MPISSHMYPCHVYVYQAPIQCLQVGMLLHIALFVHLLNYDIACNAERQYVTSWLHDFQARPRK